MTKQLEELLNLPITDEVAPDPLLSEAMDVINENREMLASAETLNDKIDAALSSVNDLDTSDKEFDELAKIAQEKFEDLFSLGMNVEARFSGVIFQTAGMLLGHAITAKQAKVDRKLKTIDLQLKKMKLDQTAAKTDGSKLLGATEGEGIVLDRNELLKQILSSKQ